MITPSSIAIILQGAPFPGAVVAVTPGGAALDLTIGDKMITFCEGAWFAAERRMTPAHLSFAAIPTAEQVHAEIRRVLAIINAPADDPADERLQDRLTDEIDRRRDLKGSLKRIGEAVGVDSGPAEHDAEKIAFIERRVEATRERCDALQQILPLLGLGVNSPADKARERIEGLLAEIDRLKGEVVDLTLRLGTTQNRVGDLESELAGVRATKKSVERDCALAAKRAAEAESARRADADLLVMRTDDLAAARTRANAAEAKVKRLLRQRRAAHDVLDEAGIGLEEQGSPRWTLARRCRAAVEPVWDHLDAVHALDEIAKLYGLTPPSLSSGATESEVIATAKTLAADAAFYRIDRPAYLEAGQARERIAAHLRLPGATWAQLADAIVAPKTSRLRRALARLAW